MLGQILRRGRASSHGVFILNPTRSKSSDPSPISVVPAHMKVAVLGAHGSVGQPLSLLLKHSTIITDLHLYDLKCSNNIATDLSHIETRCRVRGFIGSPGIQECLDGVHIVLIAAGVAKKAGMSRIDFFDANAEILFDLMEHCRRSCPKALIGIITSPINSMVPIAAEVLKRHGLYDPRKLFGVTTLDVVRANTFIAQMKKLDPGQVTCPVIGGHTGITIIPLLSQVSPEIQFTPEEMTSLTARIQEAGSDVVKSKNGFGSATLSMAYAGARFCYSLMRAMRGEPGVIECAYVKTEAPEAPYFTTKLLLGPNGVEHNLGIGKISPFEKILLKRALPALQKSIKKGEKYAKQNFPKDP